MQEREAVKRAPYLALLLWAAGCPLRVLAGCELNVVGLNFGSYDIFNALDTAIATTISMTCDTDTHYEIALSPGSGTFAARTLTNGADVLGYNLYLDPTHLTVWGDGSPGTSTITGLGMNGSFTVYGRIPAHQDAHVGSYADTITVTITF